MSGIFLLSAVLMQQFLLHIRAIPADTTDKIIYTSGDESVATVSEDGVFTGLRNGSVEVYMMLDGEVIGPQNRIFIMEYIDKNNVSFINVHNEYGEYGITYDEETGSYICEETIIIER